MWSGRRDVSAGTRRARKNPGAHRGHASPETSSVGRRPRRTPPQQVATRGGHPSVDVPRSTISVGDEGAHCFPEHRNGDHAGRRRAREASPRKRRRRQPFPCVPLPGLPARPLHLTPTVGGSALSTQLTTALPVPDSDAIASDLASLDSHPAANRTRPEPNRRTSARLGQLGRISHAVDARQATARRRGGTRGCPQRVMDSAT